jgi:hypothetical protein
LKPGFGAYALVYPDVQRSQSASLVELKYVCVRNIRRREGHVPFAEIFVAAGLVGGNQAIEVALVEAQYVVVFLDEGDDDRLLLCVDVGANAGVVHESTLRTIISIVTRNNRYQTRQFRILWIILVDHLCGDIWNISSGVGLADHDDCELGDTEYLLEVHEEVHEDFRNVPFASHSCIADGKSSANKLFNPEEPISTPRMKGEVTVCDLLKNIGEVHP